MGTVIHGQPGARYLAITLRGVDHAVPILHVREILPLRPVAPLPGAPPAVFGVLDLRGWKIPVIDLPAERSAATAPTGRSCILVMEVTVERRPCLVGLLADSAGEVIEGAPQPLDPPPDAATVSPDWLAGTVRSGARVLPLLDIPRGIRGRSWTWGGAPPAQAVSA